MNIFVTGLNGFIASHLAVWLADRGYRVTGTSRSASGRFSTTVWHLGDSIDRAKLVGVDVLIHAAHDFTPGAMNANVEGTLRLERDAAAAGVRRQILVSSISARPDAVSEYGRTKLAQEEHFLRHGHTVVRPGTVLGKGGLFGRMCGLIQTLPVLPLLDGGKARMTVIGIYDLCRAIESILQSDVAGQYNLYYADRPTLGEIMRLLRKIFGRKILFVPLPATFLLLPLSLLQCLHIRTPVDVDNLKGYITGMEPYHLSNLSEILPQPSTLEAALADVWKTPKQ